MSDTTLYAAVVAVILFSLFYFYKMRSKTIIQSFLNSYDNMMALADKKKITMINSEGLQLLGFDSLKDFHASHRYVSDLFLDNEDANEESNRENGVQFIDKHTYGKNWIEFVANRQNNQVQVKIFSKRDQMNRYYQIRVSALGAGSSYSLSFTDITDVETKRLNMKKAAEFDPLTKIYNRVKVNKELDALFINVKKYENDLTLILFDIDHFKAVNDIHGHNVGDSVLVEMASLVKGLVDKENDILARWGGEEFIVLLPNRSLKEGVKRASLLRKEVERFSFSTLGSTIRCSFGVTQLRAEDTKADFFERVDVALYEAKENGRNQVISK